MTKEFCAMEWKFYIYFVLSVFYEMLQRMINWNFQLVVVLIWLTTLVGWDSASQPNTRLYIDYVLQLILILKQVRSRQTQNDDESNFSQVVNLTVLQAH